MTQPEWAYHCYWIIDPMSNFSTTGPQNLTTKSDSDKSAIPDGSKQTESKACSPKLFQVIIITELSPPDQCLHVTISSCDSCFFALVILQPTIYLLQPCFDFQGFGRFLEILKLYIVKIIERKYILRQRYCQVCCWTGLGILAVQRNAF